MAHRAQNKDENQASSSGKNLPAPFGRYTDALDGMAKRGNIRVLVMINPIGFFYDNGQPMGIMYDVLRALETYVNEKLRARSIKVEVTLTPVRPDQPEDAQRCGGSSINVPDVWSAEGNSEASAVPHRQHSHLR